MNKYLHQAIRAVSLIVLIGSTPLPLSALTNEEFAALINDAIGSGATVTVENDSIYPWTYTDQEFKPGNIGVDNSTSRVLLTYTSEKSYIFTFKWWVSSEGGCDRFYYVFDGVRHEISGDVEPTQNAIRIPASQKGITVEFGYTKDGSATSGLDYGSFTDLKFLNEEEFLALCSSQAFPLDSVKNGSFDSYDHWAGDYNTYWYNENNEGYRYGENWECYQNLSLMPMGLYRLRANACALESYGNYDEAWKIRNKKTAAELFINDDGLPLPSAFSEIAQEDIYDGYYRWETLGGYVPYYVDHVPAAFVRDMYKTEVWSFYDPTFSPDLKVGIRCYSDDRKDRWAAWDNVELTFFTPTEVAAMINEYVPQMTNLSSQHQDKAVKSKLQTLIQAAEAASTYLAQSEAYASLKLYEPTVMASIKEYQTINELNVALKRLLDGAGTFTSPATIAEAQAMYADVNGKYEAGDYNDDNFEATISAQTHMIERMGYTYLDIAVETPGSMGDSILAIVENFSDVYSLKLSGTLNDDDVATLRDRLTNLCEVDLTELNMTDLPDRIFYDHRTLEIAKLPARLTNIGEYAFYRCYSLKHIDFPATLLSIEYDAFAECDSLQEVILPEGFTTLGNSAFYSCDQCEYVKLPSTLQTISNSAFNYNKKLKRVDFAEGLTTIQSSAFHDCEAIEKLTFPSTLRFIGNSAFAYAYALTEVLFNEGLYQIEDNAFYDCDGLTEVTLPSSLVLANASPFDYCDNLVKVTCLAFEPPYMTDQIPYGLNMEGRELYVPALSINAYKQTTGWDRFPTILPIDYLPENITVLGNLHLTLPESISANYKPTLSLIGDRRDYYYHKNYGQLTVNGEGTLSLSKFSTVWDFYNQYRYRDEVSNFAALINNSHLRSDAVEVRFYVSGNDWTFLSFPFDVKMEDIVPIDEGEYYWVIRKYDSQKRAAGETDSTWVKMTPGTTLEAGQGYIIQAIRYVDNYAEYSVGFKATAIDNGKKNNLFTTADVSVAIAEYQSEFAHNRSWNFIGNPYPAYFDSRFMSFEAPFTVWDSYNRTYKAYSPLDDAYIFVPGESFFVQAAVDQTAINFSREGRQLDRTVREIEVPAQAKGSLASQRDIFNLSLSDGTNSDRTRLVLNANAALGYETDKDAPKFMSTDASVPQLYTLGEGVEYSINERPFDNGIANLAVKIGKAGQYTLSLDNAASQYSVILKDKLNDASVDLTATEGYAFSTEAGTFLSRFEITFWPRATGIESIEDKAREDKAPYFSVDGQLLNAPAQQGIYIHNNKKVIVK